MSGYAAGEALILTVIRGLSNFSTSNTSSADWQILESGNDVRYAIAKTAPSEREGLTMRSTIDRFTTAIEVWRFMAQENSDATNAANLYGDVEDISDELQKYNRLGDTGDTILHSRVTGTDEPQEMFNYDGALEWLMQEISVEWWEERTPAYQDV